MLKFNLLFLPLGGQKVMEDHLYEDLCEARGSEISRLTQELMEAIEHNKQLLNNDMSYRKQYQEQKEHIEHLEKLRTEHLHVIQAFQDQRDQLRAVLEYALKLLGDTYEVRK